MRRTPLIVLLILVTHSQQRAAQTISIQGSTNPNVTLKLETGIIFNNGDVVPVARTDFYLLDQDLETILRGASPPFTVEKNIPTLVSSYWVWSMKVAILGSGPRSRDKANLDRASALIRPHVVATCTTGFKGDAECSAPRGSYYLLGFATIRQANVLWHLKIDLNADQKVILDQKNAVVAA
jgi:hypothetical protein